MFAAAGDMMNWRANFKAAEEVRALSGLLAARYASPTRGVSPATHDPASVAESLSLARQTLKTLLEQRPPAQPPEALPPQHPQPPSAPAPQPASAADAAAIELCDWLDRAREDQRIPPARAMEIATQKTLALLVSLGIEKIARTGRVDEADQQITDFVSCDSADLDMHVSQTVQCGYRKGGQIVRPQTVIAFRYTEAQ